jgi:ABC-type Fe3+-siderophore transport system permease subunit
MSYKVLFVINAIVVLALGLALFFVPNAVLGQFRMDARIPEIFLSRVVGAALATIGLLLWFAKDADEAAQKNLGIAALAGTVLGVVVTVMGVASGVVRANGWIAIVVELLFGLGYAFLLFLQPRVNQ